MAPSASDDLARQRLARLLGEVAPFSSLSPSQVDALVAAAQLVEHKPGALVLDGFRSPSADVYVVVTGRIGLWQEVDAKGHPNEVQGPGAFFGFSAVLTGRAVGPLVRALTRTTVARIPGPVAEPAFETPTGARFLVEHLLSFAELANALPGFTTTGSLVDQDPVVVGADEPVREVARALTERRLPGVVVTLADGSYGLVTDGSIRRRVVVEGLSPDAPASEALARGVPVVQLGDSAGEVLLEVLEARTEAAIVTDRRGHLSGVVGLREFALSPTTADVALHEQLRLAPTGDELVQLARQVPDMLAQLLRHGLATAQVVKVHSALVDTLVRRSVELCLAGHDDLGTEEFTWLALGSNGRRESVLSSDIESAVVFPNGTSEERMLRYREVFADVDALLERTGLEGDGHAVSARHRILARTVDEWDAAAQQWLRDPWRDKGGVMISLLVDSRPIVGDPHLAEASARLLDLKSHPTTMRLLLNDALSTRARLRQREMVPWRRQARFDIKRDAVLPLVNMARWVGLAVRADRLSTPDRLRAAGGTSLLDERQAAVLAEAFDVLQRVRLRAQLLQVQSGLSPSDRIDLDLVSPIDRTIIGEAVHEITLAQRRLANLADTLETEVLRPRTRP